jgi:DNA-binding response OmpR family regulator
LNTILVVDDDQVFRGLLKTVLELEGYQAVVVSHADDVMPEVRRSRPILTLMDVHVLDRDMLDVLRELRADEAFKTMPVVMTSGMDLSAECLAAGADAFLLKPFRPAELLKMIGDLIK